MSGWCIHWWKWGTEILTTILGLDVGLFSPLHLHNVDGFFQSANNRAILQIPLLLQFTPFFSVLYSHFFPLSFHSYFLLLTTLLQYYNSNHHHVMKAKLGNTGKTEDKEWKEGRKGKKEGWSERRKKNKIMTIFYL